MDCPNGHGQMAPAPESLIYQCLRVPGCRARFVVSDGPTTERLTMRCGAAGHVYIVAHNGGVSGTGGWMDRGCPKCAPVSNPTARWDGTNLHAADIETIRRAVGSQDIEPPYAPAEPPTMAATAIQMLAEQAAARPIHERYADRVLYHFGEVFGPTDESFLRSLLREMVEEIEQDRMALEARVLALNEQGRARVASGRALDLVRNQMRDADSVFGITRAPAPKPFGVAGGVGAAVHQHMTSVGTPDGDYTLRAKLRREGDRTYLSTLELSPSTSPGMDPGGSNLTQEMLEKQAERDRLIASGTWVRWCGPCRTWYTEHGNGHACAQDQKRAAVATQALPTMDPVTLGRLLGEPMKTGRPGEYQCSACLGTFDGPGYVGHACVPTPGHLTRKSGYTLTEFGREFEVAHSEALAEHALRSIRKRCPQCRTDLDGRDASCWKCGRTDLEAL